MELHILLIFAFLSLVLVANHAALTPEAYWKSVLPNTPMPKAVMDLLHPRKGNAGGGDGNHLTDIFVVYHAASDETEDQVYHNPNLVIFFLENDIKPGKIMNLHFTTVTNNAATFLPRHVAESIPFSSNKMQEIFKHFSVKPNSMEAETMKKTIKQCEESTVIKGEEKYCTTSLESMIDFSTSKLGYNVQAISTAVEKETQLQKYGITGVKKMDGEDAVVCHSQNYAYAVFNCHKTHATKTYIVSLVGADGTKAKAVAMCHTDTSQWNPKHLAFQLLKVKPGTVPICHFLNEDGIVWIAN